jgi:hypothetical protein
MIYLAALRKIIAHGLNRAGAQLALRPSPFTDGQ